MSLGCYGLSRPRDQIHFVNLKSVKILLKKKEGCQDLPVPRYATSGSSGVDLYADVNEEVTLLPGDIKLISAGIYISIPEGYEAEVRPRSGLALKHGISLVNAPGTIDSDYRGLVNLIMINHGKEPFAIHRGDRIAQMIIAKHEKAEMIQVETLNETKRGEGGFGSTGK